MLARNCEDGGPRADEAGRDGPELRAAAQNGEAEQGGGDYEQGGGLRHLSGHGADGEAGIGGGGVGDLNRVERRVGQQDRAFRQAGRGNHARYGNAADADAVQYFYEPFLAAFDPELRRQLGVWYTPREIVRRGKMPAEVLLDRYHGEWNGDVSRIYEEASF